MNFSMIRKHNKIMNIYLKNTMDNNKYELLFHNMFVQLHICVHTTIIQIFLNTLTKY
jgi:hypothetical protein